MKIPGVMKNRFFILACTALLLAAAVYGTILLLRPPADETVSVPGAAVETETEDQLAAGDIDIVPTSFDSAGVNLDSGFRIKAVRSTDPGVLQKALSVSPAQEYSIKRASSNEFLLSFKEPMEADSLYRFALNRKENTADFSWAFQTKKEFTILRTLPRDKSTGVPLNSGIEMTFSHEGIDGLDAYFDISPRVSGRFEYHKKVAVFVPDGLEYGTVYTVTVKKGLSLPGSDEKLDEDYVFQFQTQPKDTNESAGHYFGFGERVYNFTSGAVPTLTVYGDEEFYHKNDIKVELFSYNDIGEFKTDLEKEEQLPPWAQNTVDVGYDTGRLQKYLSFTTKMIFTGSPWYQQLLEFPDKLPQGYYLVSVTQDGKQYYAHLQINDLAVYIMAGSDKGRSVIWANDSITGQPAEDVKAAFGDGREAVTDVTGVATLDGVNLEKAGNFITLTPATGPAFLAMIGSSGLYGNPYLDYTAGGNSAGAAETYWSYLYLDRGMYLTDDKIRAWGLVKPRDPNKSTSRVTLSLNKYVYSDYSSEESTLVTKELDVSPYGTFSGELAFENYNPGSYFVTVKTGDITLEQTYVEISNYTKPAYKIDVTQDKKSCFTGETVNFDVQAGFFEGTPVSGLDIGYRTYTGSSSVVQAPDGKLVCGSDGKAALKYTPISASDSSSLDWNPVYMSFVFENASAEEQSIQASGSVLVFPRDVMIDTAGAIKDNKIKIDIKTNKIDPSKLEQPVVEETTPAYGDAAYDQYRYRGGKIDMGLNVRVYEKRWESEVTGKYYDFINKVTRDKYRYYEVKSQIGEFNLSSVDGVASCELPLNGDTRFSSYYAEVTGIDTRGRPISTTAYIYSSNVYQDYLERMEMSKTYSLKDANDLRNYRLDSKASVKVLENGGDLVAPENGRVLFMTLKGSLVDLSVVNGSEYDLTFNEDLIPDAFVKAVYFDGVNIYDAGSLILDYDYTERGLNISLKPDKEQYRPGDTVNLDAYVTDSSGKPCEAELNLSVVDEAFFALREQWVNTAASIYSYVFGSGITNEYFSYSLAAQRYPMAECGEGGDGAPARTDFRDNAFFGNLTTGTDGTGKISFKLPDNLTSWRVTCQAVTKNLKAGNARIDLDSKLPFFVSLLFNDTYMEGDSPGISLRCFGTETGGSDRVKYEVTISGPGGYSKKYEKEQTANQFCNISMESLKAGDYSVTAAAVCGSHRDAVKKDFKVVGSMLETARNAYVTVLSGANLASGLEISAQNSLVEVTFYNRNVSKYNRMLNSLYYSWGSRVDQVLARKLAGEYLKKYFGSRFADAGDIELSGYQTDEGGIALLTYDSPDPQLSARICSLGRQYFSQSDLEAYFENVIENKKSTNEDIAASYWGLASLGRPVLLDVKAFLKEEGISLKEKLYLGNALAEIGDYSGARDDYAGILKDYGKNLGGYLYIDSGGEGDETAEMTALCSLLAIKLGAAEKDALFNYVDDKATDELLLNLEKLTWLSLTVPKTEQTGSFTVNTGEGAEKAVLKGTERKSYVLPAQKLKTAEITDVTGDIEAALKFTGPLDTFDAAKDSPISITRLYIANDKITNSFKHSDIVEVDLELKFDADAPEGYYQITDVLPSGLRYIPPREWKWEGWYLNGVDGQKVNFGYFRNPGKSSASIRYLARVVSPGSYSADNAVLKHARSQCYSFSGRNQVVIDGD